MPLAKHLQIAEVQFEGVVPPERVQLAHNTVVGEYHRKHQGKYPFIQSVLDDQGMYKIIVFENMIPIAYDWLKNKRDIHFFHEKEDFYIRPVSIEFYPEHRSLLACSDTIYFYLIRAWCPFDARKYKYYNELFLKGSRDFTQSPPEAIEFLRSTLHGHLNAMITSLNDTIQYTDIMVGIRQIIKKDELKFKYHKSPSTQRIEKNPVQHFDLMVGTNLIIPFNMGVGRSAKYNAGRITELKTLFHA